MHYLHLHSKDHKGNRLIFLTDRQYKYGHNTCIHKNRKEEVTKKKKRIKREKEKSAASRAKKEHDPKLVI